MASPDPNESVTLTVDSGACKTLDAGLLGGGEAAEGASACVPKLASMDCRSPWLMATALFSQIGMNMLELSESRTFVRMLMVKSAVLRPCSHYEVVYTLYYTLHIPYYRDTPQANFSHFLCSLFPLHPITGEIARPSYIYYREYGSRECTTYRHPITGGHRT